MESFSTLLAICAGNSPVSGEFPAQRPVTRSSDVIFYLCLNKRLSKQSWGWWFETPSCPLKRHSNVHPHFPFRQTTMDPYPFRVHTYCAAGYLLRTELHPFNKDATCNIGVQTKLHSTLHSIFYFLSTHVASFISTQYLLFNISNQHPDPFNFHPAYWRHAPYYHLHNIRRIRKFLSQEATCTIINAFIASQIDYCNSLMNGLPENLFKKLQRVQNTAARLVFNLRKYDHITPALVTLHWLPVKYRIEFKTLLIDFKGLHGKAPTYIQEMTIPSKIKRYSIRSNEERVLRFQNSSMILSASVHSQCMDLWHGIVCQRKLDYVLKLKHSSET